MLAIHLRDTDVDLDGKIHAAEFDGLPCLATPGVATRFEWRLQELPLDEIYFFSFSAPRRRAEGKVQEVPRKPLQHRGRSEGGEKHAPGCCLEHAAARARTRSAP